jgi:hypothetical protein
MQAAPQHRHDRALCQRYLNADSASVVTANFDLPGVEPGTNRDSERFQRIAEREGAADGTAGSVEGCEKSVSSQLHDSAAGRSIIVLLTAS